MKRRGPLLMALAVGALFARAAQATISEDVITAISEKYGPATVLIKLPEGRGRGTGIVIRRKPIIVATCVHVIEGQAEVSIESRTVMSETDQLRARRAFVVPDSDIAFLLVEGTITQWPTSIDWRVGVPKTGDALLFGYATMQYPEKMDLRVLQTSVSLVDLGEPKVASLRIPALRVIELRGEFRAGMSGSPVVDAAGNLLGLGAGTVTQNNKLERHFAIPVGTLADPMTFAPLPVNGSDPYNGAADGNGPVRSRAYVRDAASLSSRSLGAEALACAARIEKLVGRYPNRSDLPPALKGPASCGAQYVAMRGLLVQEGLELKRTSELDALEASARRIEIPARSNAGRDAIVAAASDPKLTNKTIRESFGTFCSKHVRVKNTASDCTVGYPFEATANLRWGEVASDRATERKLTADFIRLGLFMTDDQLAGIDTKAITPVGKFIEPSAAWPDTVTMPIKTAARKSAIADRIVTEAGLTSSQNANDKRFALEIAATAVDPVKKDSSDAAREAAAQAAATITDLRDAERAILSLPANQLPKPSVMRRPK
jgi:hypothetical protein